MTSPVIVIKLAGRSPRLVRRWRELGLLPGFAMLTHQPSPQQAHGQFTFDDLEHDSGQNRQVSELWANGPSIGSNSELDAGIKTKLPDLGTESVIDALPEHHSVQELVSLLRDAGLSVLAIARALASCRPTVFDRSPTFEQTSHDWLRWEIFKSRWLAEQPGMALLNLPCPDQSGQPQRLATADVDMFGVQKPFFCPEQQLDYAQSLMASYLTVDAIMQQAVRVADRRRARLIVSVDSRAREARKGCQQRRSASQPA